MMVSNTLWLCLSNGTTVEHTGTDRCLLRQVIIVESNDKGIRITLLHLLGLISRRVGVTYLETEHPKIL